MLHTDRICLLSLLTPSLLIFIFYVSDQPIVFREILASIMLACVGYILTVNLIPYCQNYVRKRGIFGKDLCKKGTPAGEKDIPEAMGVVPGLVFLVCMTICEMFYASSREQLVDYNSALLSVCFMMFLGFLDDMLDLPWRIKLFLPSFASLPLLVTYDGSTWVTVPRFLRSLLCMEGGKGLTILGELINIVFSVDSERGAIIELGVAYMVYMGLLAVFCTNAINIYAGINGLEAGQSFVIGCALLLFNMIEISLGHHSGTERVFAVMILFPFLATTMGLLQYNWYPARVFVGDTYCYFSGMSFAVVGIHGHFSKTLLLMFIPQVLNFLYSVPQLFKFVPCPRHRLPKFNPETGLLEPSGFECDKKEYRWIKVKADDNFCPNMTLLCLALRWFGPMKEKSLVILLLSFQVLCCAFGFFVRYYVSALLF